MTKTKQAIQHNRQVKEYAHGPLFSKLKLFSDPTELHYTTKAGVCQSICKAMKVQEVYREKWWNYNSKIIRDELNKRRSEVTAQMQKVFIGKFHCCQLALS